MLRSLADFLKELPVTIKRAEPSLALLFGDDPPLERRLKLRELQTSYVYTVVLAKKSKVRPGLEGSSDEFGGGLARLSRLEPGW